MKIFYKVYLYVLLLKNELSLQLDSLKKRKDLCQEFDINPTYGNHPRGGVNRVMVSFRKFKQVNARDNYMQVYNNQYIDNCI